MKKISLIAGVLFSLQLNAQLKVNVNGQTVMGALNATTTHVTTIQQASNNYGTGSLLVRSTDLRNSFYIGQYNANAHLGSTTDVLAFYHWFTAYQHVWFSGYSIASDRSIKTNIRPALNNIDLLKKFEPVSYHLKDDLRSKDPKLTYGFIAQDVNEFMPEITDTCNGLMGISYHQLIPILVGGIKEQQNQIDSLESTISELKAEVSHSNGTQVSFSNIDAELFQNSPNPFTDRTTINFEIKSEFRTAEILVFDMNGKMLKAYTVEPNQSSRVVIEGNELEAGMYLYSLVVDGQEVDTKRMILNK